MSLTSVWLQTLGDGLVRADQVVGVDVHQTPALTGKASHWLLDVVLPTPIGSGARGEWDITIVHRTLGTDLRGAGRRIDRAGPVAGPARRSQRRRNHPHQPLPRRGAAGQSTRSRSRPVNAGADGGREYGRPVPVRPVPQPATRAPHRR